MVTRRLTIKERNRTHPIVIVGPGDFSCEPSTEIEPSEVVDDPRFSLYCFDPENHVAIFVECDDHIAVDRAPFYYQAQAEKAVGLVSMPLETFHRIADQLPDPLERLIWIHSVGRCGSTLLSKVLDAVPNVCSLSEPDDLTQMVNLRNSGTVSDGSLKKLLVSSVRWRGKPRLGRSEKYLAIKPRSEVLVLADLIGVSFKEAKHFFLYRDGLSWMRTIFRTFPENRDVNDVELNSKMEDSWSRTLPLVRQMRTEGAPMNPVQLRILAWITCMEGYLSLSKMGVSAAAARFEDLTSQPKPILEQFFEFCGIGEIDWAAIEEVLGRDSQAGTIFGREERRDQNRVLTDDLVHDVEEQIALRCQLKMPGVILPGTFRLPTANR